MSGYFYSFKERKAKEPSKGIKVRSVYLENLMMTHMEYTAPIVKTFFLVFLFLFIHIYLYSLSGGQGDVPPHLTPFIHAAFSKYSL